MCDKNRRVVQFDTGFLFIIMALRDYDVDVVKVQASFTNCTKMGIFEWLDERMIIMIMTFSFSPTTLFFPMVQVKFTKKKRVYQWQYSSKNFECR